MSKLRVVIAQLNLHVGDIAGNLQKHIQAAVTARDTLQADIIVFPELSITGYPPEDLLFRKDFIRAAENALQACIVEITDIHCIIGHPYATAKGLYNACSLIYNGNVLGRYAKRHLPNYSVFDERRYFIPGESAGVISVLGIPIGIVICEDLWFAGPTQQSALEGAKLILSPNASPFEITKEAQRESMLRKRATTSHIPIVYANCVGGQDELVFDGGSMVVDAEGKICQHAGFFQEKLLPVDITIANTNSSVTTTPFVLPNDEEKIYECLVLGVRDYVERNRFPGALIGLSGGIDSALALTIAVDALGKDRVSAILMPSRYTKAMSTEDAMRLADNLGVKHETISIEPTFTSFLSSLAPLFKDKKPDITEENIQARCRGVILMALSNKTGRIVLTTGNRSEMAVGYATLYGDMAGGFAVLKDVPKTTVYRLANYRNEREAVIPQRIIDRPPTAELAFDQKDEDSLPAYSILDAIVALYIEQEKSVDDIVALGFERDVVKKIVGFIKKNEYKRRQAPLGVRINHHAFGKDRRYPVTAAFEE